MVEACAFYDGVRGATREVLELLASCPRERRPSWARVAYCPSPYMRNRAVALGWRLDQIIVIDSDLGQSGASAVDREGVSVSINQCIFFSQPLHKEYLTRAAGKGFYSTLSPAADDEIR